MANIKISELPSSGILTATDILPAVASNITSKVTVQELAQSLFPDDIYAVVGSSGVITINDGDDIITLPQSFSGYRVRVFRNGTILDFENQGLGDPYYTYNSTTREISLSVNAVSDEKFVIIAY